MDQHKIANTSIRINTRSNNGKKCHTLMKISVEKYRYILEIPEINKFIKKFYKKILFFKKIK